MTKANGTTTKRKATKTDEEPKAKRTKTTKEDDEPVTKATKAADTTKTKTTKAAPKTTTKAAPKKAAAKPASPKKAAAKTASPKKVAAKAASPKKAAAKKAAPKKPTTSKTAAKPKTKTEPKAEAESETETKPEPEPKPAAKAKAPKAAPKAPKAKAAPKAAPKAETKTEDKTASPETEKPSKKRKVEAAAIHKVEVPFSGLSDVLVLGSGEVGQLGLGTTILGRKRPTVVPEVSAKHILKMTPGGLHNAVLVQNDQNNPANTTLWTWGCNDNKILGRSTPVQEDETVDLSMKPDIVPALEGKNIIDVVTGEYHMAALSNTGSVYLWGTYKDNEGFLGYSEKQRSEQETPQLYPKLDVPIKQLASGYNHTIALTYSGTVLIWGFYWLGRRVSDRMKRTYLVPQVLAFPKNYSGKITKVVAGGYHSFAFAEDGTIFGWGLNNNGQLGNGNTVDQGAPVEIESLKHHGIIDIAAGMHHTLALAHGGTVYAFGRGDYGQLGNGNTDASTKPVQVNFGTSLAANDKVIHIACGDNHNTAVTQQGVAFAWGFGESGQIGNADKDSNGDDSNVPFRVDGPQLKTRTVKSSGAGGQHTILLTTSPPAAPEANGVSSK